MTVPVASPSVDQVVVSSALQRVFRQTPHCLHAPMRLQACRPLLIDKLGRQGLEFPSIVGLNAHASTSWCVEQIFCLTPRPVRRFLKGNRIMVGGSTMSHASDQVLSDFGKCTMALAERLEQDPQYGLIEQVFIENHIHILQSVYSSWKRRQLNKASGE